MSPATETIQQLGFWFVPCKEALLLSACHSNGLTAHPGDPLQWKQRVTISRNNREWQSWLCWFEGKLSVCSYLLGFSLSPKMTYQCAPPGFWELLSLQWVDQCQLSSLEPFGTVFLVSSFKTKRPCTVFLDSWEGHYWPSNRCASIANAVIILSGSLYATRTLDTATKRGSDYFVNPDSVWIRIKTWVYCVCLLEV